jgi:hypothetical protein
MSSSGINPWDELLPTEFLSCDGRLGRARVCHRNVLVSEGRGGVGQATAREIRSRSRTGRVSGSAGLSGSGRLPRALCRE